MFPPRIYPSFAILSLVIAPVASAGVVIDTKADKSLSSKTEEHWGIRIAFENPFDVRTPQYSNSGYAEFDRKIRRPVPANDGLIRHK